MFHLSNQVERDLYLKHMLNSCSSSFPNNNVFELSSEDKDNKTI